MRKSVQKNHNKAGFKKNHSPHPSNKKSTDFIPSIRIKSAPLFFNSTSQTPSDPHQTHYRPIGPIRPIRPIRHKKHQ